jgi:hypothetical protein
MIAPMPTDEARELKETVDRVVDSKSAKKLVIAGPGAGKTFLFKKLLEAQGWGCGQSTWSLRLSTI